MCIMSSSSCDDKRSLVDRNLSLDEPQEDSASSNKKLRFFSIGFNSKPDAGRQKSAGDSPEQHSQLHNGVTPKPLTSTDTRRSLWRDKSQNKEHITTINDQLASFDTEESYEDDVFSKGIIDLDDTNDGDLGMGDLLPNKPLFPRGDSLDTPSPNKTSDNTDDADIDLPGLSDVHDRIESRSKFNDLYYCTGSTEDLLKEVTGEEQADKQTRKLVSQYRKLRHNPADRVGDAGDDDSLASGSSSSKEPEDHTPLISDEEDIARDDDEISDIRVSDYYLANNQLYNHYMMVGGHINMMPLFGKKKNVEAPVEETPPKKEATVVVALQEKALEEKAPEPENKAEPEQKVEEKEAVVEPAPEEVKTEEPAKTEEPTEEPDSSKPEENNDTKDSNGVNEEGKDTALPALTTGKSEKSPLITKNGCESGTEVNGSGVNGDSKFKDTAPGVLCCTIL